MTHWKLYPALLITVRSKKPKIGSVECLVPDCNRAWELIGSNQGFTHAVARSHACAHWRKYHEEHEHPGEWNLACPLCAEASAQEIKKRHGEET